MAFYLGNSDKQKIILDGIVYRCNIYRPAPDTNFIKLLSSDNYILRGLQGLYLTVEEDE